MCLAGRIGILWLAPPITSFSVARHPRLRSKMHALGHFNLDMCERGSTVAAKYLTPFCGHIASGL